MPSPHLSQSVTTRYWQKSSPRRKQCHGWCCLLNQHSGKPAYVSVYQVLIYWDNCKMFWFLIYTLNKLKCLCKNAKVNLVCIFMKSLPPPKKCVFDFRSLLVGHFCENNAFYILLSWLPTYFHENFPDAKVIEFFQLV